MEQKIIAIRSTCRVCDFSPLAPILSLGKLQVSDFISESSKHHNEDDGIPLELALCNKKDGGCGLLQLKHTISHEAMYRQYWYRSGINKSMTDELRGIASKVESLIKLNAGDFVIDIGSNDSTLLRNYSIGGLRLIGFEPARNLMKYAQEGVTKIFNDFFNFSAWEREYPGAKAKAITAIAMFYDLEDPNKFVEDVTKCLDRDGVFIIQMSYLPSMLSQNAFDNICHEHLEYYSLLSLENLLMRHNLEIFDIELNDVNGGSFRIYIRRKNEGRAIQISNGAEKRIEDLRKFEEKLGLDNEKVYIDFVRRVYSLRDQLTAFVNSEVKNGKKIYIYGASTKGNTLLQFYGLDNALIVAAAERNSEKWGLKTVGTLIPIISEEQARKDKPDYFLVLPWAFLDEFVKREEEYLKSGGKFLVPLPEFRVVSV